MAKANPENRLRRLTRAARAAFEQPAAQSVGPDELPRELLKAIKRQNAIVSELSERLERAEASLKALNDGFDKVFARVKHLEPGIGAILRRLHVDPELLPYPERLTAHRFRLHSQNQEDGITLGLLGRAGATNRRFVELGSGLSGGNSAVLALEFGWTGLMVDGDAAHMTQVARRFPGVTAVAAWITRDTVNDLIVAHGFGGELDLLSIDLDGNDYWIWEAVTACSPRLVIVEYNSMFGPDRAVTIPYDPQFDRRKQRFVYYGASLTALARLAGRKGYRLVATGPTGVNAFFLRHDVAPDVPACEPARAFHLLRKYDVLMKDKNLDIFAYVRDAGLPLVEIE